MSRIHVAYVDGILYNLHLGNLNIIIQLISQNDPYLHLSITRCSENDFMSGRIFKKQFC